MAADCGEDLKWEEEYMGIGENPVSAIYFELTGVNIYCQEDSEQIYAFFIGLNIEFSMINAPIWCGKF